MKPTPRRIAQDDDDQVGCLTCSQNTAVVLVVVDAFLAAAASVSVDGERLLFRLLLAAGGVADDDIANSRSLRWTVPRYQIALSALYAAELIRFRRGQIYVRGELSDPEAVAFENTN